MFPVEAVAFTAYNVLEDRVIDVPVAVPVDEFAGMTHVSPLIGFPLLSNAWKVTVWPAAVFPLSLQKNFG